MVKACVKKENCLKLKPIYDQDLLVSQIEKAIKDVCRKCKEGKND